MINLSELENSLRRHRPRVTRMEDYPGYRHAAVACILRETPDGPEIFYILRSRCDADPWSGDIAFPGGHIEVDDDHARFAAERETLEETGLDLRNATFLGRLDDLAGAHLSIIVCCFVYLLPMPLSVPLKLNAEVHQAFWIPCRDLLDPARRRMTTVHFRGARFERPALDLLGPKHTVLWGITYRLTAQFLEINGHSLPQTPIP